MTQDEIIRMAREAGFEVDEGLFPFEAAEDKYIGTERTLERFAALVAAHEREKQAEQEPDYFGLTHDHTWLSIDKKQYDKLKPEGRMACYAAPVRTKDLTDDEIEMIFKSHIGKQYDDFARAVIAADREKNK